MENFSLAEMGNMAKIFELDHWQIVAIVAFKFDLIRFCRGKVVKVELNLEFL